MEIDFIKLEALEYLNDLFYIDNLCFNLLREIPIVLPTIYSNEDIDFIECLLNLPILQYE